MQIISKSIEQLSTQHLFPEMQMVRMREAFKWKKCVKLRGIPKPEFQPVLHPPTLTTETIPEGLLLSRMEKCLVCFFELLFCFTFANLTHLG